MDDPHRGRLGARRMQVLPLSLDLGRVRRRLATLCSSSVVERARTDTTHTLRHGGPSHDVWVGARDLHQVQKHGHWAAFASVSRYEKHARLLRQIAKTTRHEGTFRQSKASGSLSICCLPEEQ